ncbi:MAG: glycosyltransferase family protein [Anaerovibrio sp.]|nr:glycosyltransferase family protein [Anaerovibrio sp.]
MKVLAIVQARCSSSRLPGKVIKRLAGKPMIVHEIERLERSKLIDEIVLATSTDSSDDALASIVLGTGTEVFRGNLEDVLDRYYQCAERHSPEHVVRITGDCPVIDWRLIDTVIKTHIEHGNDYTNLSGDYPDGLDTEVMKFSVLKEAWEKAKMLSEREHVTLYIHNHKDDFRMERIPCDKKLGDLRWTVDEPQDFSFVEKVFSELYGDNPDFAMDDILELLDRKPELAHINSGIMRNEGLAKSLANDREIDG